jgi:hypothetical protein
MNTAATRPETWTPEKAGFSRPKQMDDPEFKKMFPMIQSMQAKDIKITGGTMSEPRLPERYGQGYHGWRVTTGTIDMVMKTIGKVNRIAGNRK